MKKFNWIIAVIFSISMTSCDMLLYLPTDDGSTSQPSQNPSSSDKSTSPAPKTPLPPPSKGNQETTTRNDKVDPEMEQFYKDLNLTNSQIAQFEGIYNKYQQDVKDAKLKYKGNQISLNKKLKSLESQRETNIKAMMSDAQYQKYVKFMEEKNGKSTKGSIGG